MPWVGLDAYRSPGEHLARLHLQQIVDSLDAFGLLCSSLRFILSGNGFHPAVQGNNLIDNVNVDLSGWCVGIINKFRFDFGVDPGIIKRVPYLVAELLGLLARSTCHVLCILAAG